VTVIAAGFDSGQLPYKKVEIRRESAPQVTGGTTLTIDTERRRAEPAAGYSMPTTTTTSNGSRPIMGIEDELDVPDFLKS
jgi:cell division protein FtsZ